MNNQTLGQFPSSNIPEELHHPFVLLPRLPWLCYRNHALIQLFRGASHTMPGLLQRSLPRETGFFDLFAKQAVNIHVGAEALLKMLSHYTGVHCPLV
jgi:hypothetical protein